MQALDFKAMYKAEQKKRQDPTPRAIELAPLTVFNMLNDMRHLVIYDVRSPQKFQVSHVRDSFLLRDPGKEEALFKAASKIVEDDLNPGSDTLRRILLICEQDTLPLESSVKAGQKLFDKVYSIKGGFQQLASQFPFCLVYNTNKEYLKLAEIPMDLAKKAYLSEAESELKQQIVAKSRYPFIVTTGELYVGSYINVMSSRQLDLLNIKTVIALSKNAELKISKGSVSVSGGGGDEESKEAGGLEVVRFPYDEKDKPMIEFDTIYSAVEEAEKPVLVFCLNGMMSAAFGVYYLMKQRSVNREVATMIVLKGRPEFRGGMPAWLYSQLNFERVSE